MKKYNGVLVPMITPFTRAGKIDHKHLKELLQKIIDHQCHPFVMGTTGEGLSIPLKERIDLMKGLSVFKNKGSHLYASVSSVCHDDMLYLAKKASDFGIDVVVAHLPPQYPLSTIAMMKWFEELANKSSCPVMVYNILSTTNMSIPLEIIDQLSKHPNIIGLKDSEKDEHRLKEAVKRWKDRPDFSYMIGWATKSYEGLKLGSDGIVPSSGNVLPEVYRQLWDAILKGEDEKGKMFQQVSDELGKIYQQGRLLPDSLSALKVILKAEDLCEPYVLPPLQRLEERTEREVVENYKAFYAGIKNKLNQ